jgi:LDH2 family malate/lactate/ureidoglycolate dehydrogenase
MDVMTEAATVGGERGRTAGPLDRALLDDFAARVLMAAGMPPSVARHTARSIVDADARGHPSHGIDLLPAYYRGLRSGRLRADAEVAVVHEKGAVAVLDGDGGLGYETSRLGMLKAVELAGDHGVGLVTARNSNHFGMAAHWASIAVEHGMIGFATTNGPPVMAPWGGCRHTICNNPLAWGIPAGDEPPILLDMACSATARGKVRMAAQRGEEIPTGWALDAQGAPTTDATAALAGILLPVGGAKGSGLAIVNEVLAGVLPAALTLTQVTMSTMASTGIHDYWGNGHFFLAIDVAAFGRADEVLGRIDAMIRELRSVPLADGFSEVRMPGERSHLAMQAAAREGIRLGSTTLDKLEALGRESGVAWRPEGRGA